ncbi:MAG: EAL domain-containing protein [Elusimicrobia bacterium]|nr:EAL domain-containing protein [Elusimicrobiota bacterium]
MDDKTLEAGLRRALERGEFLLHYQPQIDARTGRLDAVEALIRWRRGDDGLVSPALFIPAAERTGLIVEIGDWVLREACRQSRLWLDAGLPAARMAVNLSARQFADAALAARVDAALAAARLEPRDLELEITESMMARDPDAAAAVLRRLRSAGVRLMIDDFGTGYSSLASLKRFPIDGLKIDRAFVRHLPGDRFSSSIVRAVVALSGDLGLETVAEGVETPAQREFLAELGCGLLQGYLLGAPMPADALAARLAGALV